MEECARISMAREDVAEWFDWNRHRVVTPLDLATELEMLAADMEVVLSQLLLSGEIDQHSLGYHRAGRRTAMQVWNPPALQALVIPPESSGAMAHVGLTERQEKLA